MIVYNNVLQGNNLSQVNQMTSLLSNIQLRLPDIDTKHTYIEFIYPEIWAAVSLVLNWYGGFAWII